MDAPTVIQLINLILDALGVTKSDGRNYLLKLEHFLYGKLDGKGYGYETRKSPDVDKILSENSFNKLVQNDIGIVKAWIPEDRLISRSYVGYTLDQYQRHSVWNHTILIFVTDYIKIQNMDVVDKHFIREGASVPKHLEPLKIKVK